MIVIAILGIIAFCAFPRFFIQESLCLYHLRNRLQKANQEFLMHYARSITENQAPKIDLVLQELTKRDDPRCYFELKDHRLVAHFDTKALEFVITPKDFSSKPKIYCQLSNQLCRNFWGKQLKK
ncbi:hypothetical protein LW138_06100 [Helicobacter sp. faydin-H17]|nr:hypothetical protein [Helicobacter kayseriensis]